MNECCGIILFVLSLAIGVQSSNLQCYETEFPEGFLFSASSSAYQIEGAWNKDGRTDSIWDDLVHQRPYLVRDNATGDIADNSYYIYKRDIEILREIGLQVYRFSISWNRILPTGFPNKINYEGVAYYDNLINELLKYNIIPVVTIYHFDLPQRLQELGGWVNPYVVDWLGDYARVVFNLFGDRVKYWITVNEPQQICYYGYGDVMNAPALNYKGIAEYYCAKNVLLAHARAYHIYDEEFRDFQQGIIFIAISAEWYEPASSDKNDILAAYDSNMFTYGQYAHPIFSETGDFPQKMKDRIAERSVMQGFVRSRLPQLSEQEIDYIRGSSDVFGLNHYSTFYASRNQSVYTNYESPSFFDDMAAYTFQPPEWRLSPDAGVATVPWGFYKLLQFIKREYNNPPVFVTENGFGDNGGLKDNDRVTHLKGYLCALLKAINHGSDIIGYSVWSLLDSFEWMCGY
ncbi:seminal fluid protein CSSFP001, partial [Danaus plexippus plexippus]